MIIALVVAIAAAPAANAGFKVLYDLSRSGFAPIGRLAIDRSGNLYGVAVGGKTAVHGETIVFKLTPSGDYETLYTFPSAGGTEPLPLVNGGLAIDRAGNLYGATFYGGVFGAGSVFEVTQSGQLTVLYNFCSAPGCTDGLHPHGELAIDRKGNLYGTTIADVAGTGAGTLFEVTPNGQESVLYRFCSLANCADGAFPNGGLILDVSGNLYGATLGGGDHDEGAVFKLTPDGQETVLYSLCFVNCGGAVPNSGPNGGLIMDASGNIYGTDAGTSPAVVFRIAPDGTETTLHTFDGGFSPNGDLVIDKAGTLYGTIGSILYRLQQDGTYTVLCRFANPASHCGDGRSILFLNGLIADRKGNIYGTTQGRDHLLFRGNTIFEWQR